MRHSCIHPLVLATLFTLSTGCAPAEDTAAPEAVAAEDAKAGEESPEASVENEPATPVASDGEQTVAAVSAQVTSLTLIDADADQPVSGFDPIPSEARIELSSLGTRRLNVRANTTGTVGSVRFALDSNPSFRTENSALHAHAVGRIRHGRVQ